MNTQALICMAYDLSSEISGLASFLYMARKMQQQADGTEEKPRMGFQSLRILIRPGVWTFLESALRNAIYLWLISGMVAM